MARKPYVNVNTTKYMPDHGHAKKYRIVIHETVSHDHEGLTDIIAIAKYLGNKGYGIHLVIDQEGKSGYSADERAIYWQAKGDNEPTIGIELVSFIPGLNISRWQRLKIWLSRERQLHKAARWIAYYSDKHDIPIRHVSTRIKGVTSHWNVSKYSGLSGGHWDAWPKHQGGHFPMKRLIKFAKAYQTGALPYKKMREFKLGTST